MLALIFFIVALPAPMPGQCLDPDERTDAGIRALDWGTECKRRSPSPKMNGPVPLALQASVKRYNDVHMLDGLSARYLWPAHREKAGWYCGFVNGKNRMGGYTGYRRFLATYSLPGFKIESLTMEKTVVDPICDGAGYPAEPDAR